MFKQRHSHFSAVTKPTVQHAIRSTPLTNSQAERLLSAFLTDVDSSTLRLATTASSTFGNGAAVSPANASAVAQLKRVQRDLRGLPPTLQPLAGARKNNSTVATAASTTTTSAKSNKHITFDDEVETAAATESKVKQENSNNNISSGSSDEDNFVDSKMELDEEDKEDELPAKIKVEGEESSKIKVEEEPNNIKVEEAEKSVKSEKEKDKKSGIKEEEPVAIAKKDKKEKKSKKEKKEKKDKKEKKSKKSSK